MISAQDVLNRLIDSNELFYDEMLDIMRRIMNNELEESVVAAILMGLRVKVESVQEITAAATVMREFAVLIPIKPNLKDQLTDLVGTGGDGVHTFNISTASLFVAAAADAKMAKHGNRSVSSSSGSADVLRELGLNIDTTPEQVADCIETLNLGFIYAPLYHSAMKNVAKVRKSLGVRTVFNILGPLTNPAGAKRQLIGVFHKDLVGILARVLNELESEHALVVHGSDGMDELTLSGFSYVAELKNKKIKEYQLHPNDFGLNCIENLNALKVDSPSQSAVMIRDIFNGKQGATRDIVLLNSGAALYVSGIAKDIQEGVQLAAQVIDSGKALDKLAQMIKYTQNF